MMWVLLALVLIEAAVTHFLIALWSGRVALAASILSSAAVIWLVRLIRSFRAHPVQLSRDRLLWRVGVLRSVEVPIGQVKARREDWTVAGIRKAGAFNAALIAPPNVVLELDPPCRMGRRLIRFLAHRLDDPQAFNAALDDLLVRA
jgi:hypothetical protein